MDQYCISDFVLRTSLVPKAIELAQFQERVRKIDIKRTRILEWASEVYFPPPQNSICQSEITELECPPLNINGHQWPWGGGRV